MSETIIPPEAKADSEAAGGNGSPQDEDTEDMVAAAQIAAAFAPMLPQIFDSFFKSRAIYAREIEGSQRINMWLILGVVGMISTTAIVSLYMLLRFLGPDEGAKFFTMISTLLGGLLGGLGIGLALKKSRK